MEIVYHVEVTHTIFPNIFWAVLLPFQLLFCVVRRSVELLLLVAAESNRMMTMDDWKVKRKEK